MPADDLDVLSTFVTVAEERSFTKAARRLGVSTSALSHAIRGLEERVGVRLLARTTRSVAPTAAGDKLLGRLRPAIGDIRHALDALAGLRETPAGRVRLLVSPFAAAMIVTPALPALARAYPDIVLDVTIDADRGDLVEGRFDAGIHLGEFVARDMIAVRVSGPQRAAIVVAPRYFDTHSRPRTPRDLTAHRCLNFRQGARGVYRWEFEKHRKSVAVAVDGPLVTNDTAMMLQAAREGVGLAFTMEAQVAPDLASGTLLRVLEDWCPPFPGYFLYYPSRRQQPAALAAVIDALRSRV